MSDTTGSTPADGTPDSTPTEALPLADQQPLAAQPAAAAPAAPAVAPQSSGGSHTRTILEVIGGVVAAGLIVVAGAVGFAVGHATGGDDGRWSLTSDARVWQDGPDAGAPMGPGQGFGREGGQRRGHDGQGPGGQMGIPGQGFGQEVPDDDAITPQG
jgi:hypothetical protein